MTDYNSRAKSILNDMPDEMDVSLEDVVSKLEELHEDYKVPLDQAEVTTRRNLQDDYGGDISQSSSSQSANDQDVDLGELEVSHDEQWINIRGTVQTLFELSDAQDDWMEQRGVIGDDTGTTVFTTPERAVDENPDLEFEAGETVELTGVVGDAYQGKIGVKITKTTTVERSDTSYTPPENDTKFTGAIVDIQSNSGLIERCPHDGCTRVVSSTDGNENRCPVHGAVENPEDDMRLKTIIDDGSDSYQVYFDREKTEALTGITMERARQIAQDARSIGAPENEMRPMLIGRHYRIAGNEVGEYVIANKFEQVERDWETEGQNLIDTLAELQKEVEA